MMDTDKIEERIEDKVKGIDRIISKFLELGKDSGGDYKEEIDELLDIRLRYKACKERVGEIREKING